MLPIMYAIKWKESYPYQSSCSPGPGDAISSEMNKFICSFIGREFLNSLVAGCTADRSCGYGSRYYKSCLLMYRERTTWANNCCLLDWVYYISVLWILNDVQNTILTTCPSEPLQHLHTALQQRTAHQMVMTNCINAMINIRLFKARNVLVTYKWLEYEQTWS